MSNREADGQGAALAGIESLESAVRRLIEEVHELRRVAAAANERARRSEDLLREFAEGRQDLEALSQGMAKVKAENHDLRGRIERGRERIDRIFASIRFLEARR